MIWFSWLFWHRSQCYLMLNSVYTYVLNICFGLGGFMGISTIIGFLMPNPLYTYISNKYDLAWLGFMAFQPLNVI